MELEERNRIITENHKLIYKFIHKHNLDLKEWYGVIATGLIKAVDNFDKKQNTKLSTFAFKVMEREYLNELQKLKRDSLTYAISTEATAYEDTPIIDTIASKTQRNELSKLKTPAFTKREKEVLSYYLQGFSNSEIGRILKVTSERVRQIMDRIKEKYRRINGGTRR